MVFVFNVLSAISAVLAASAWIYSSRVKCYPADSPEPRPPGPSYPTPQLGMGRDRKGQQYELFATLRLQSKWNGITVTVAFFPNYTASPATARNTAQGGTPQKSRKYAICHRNSQSQRPLERALVSGLSRDLR